MDAPRQKRAYDAPKAYGASPVEVVSAATCCKTTNPPCTNAVKTSRGAGKGATKTTS